MPILPDFHKYQVIPVPGGMEAGERKFSEGVEIRFFDEYGRVLKTMTYGVVSQEEIFSLIDEGKALELDSCYIKDFSLSDYRHKKGLQEDDEVVIPPITARQSFFDHQRWTDFSFARFSEGKLDLSEACFANGEVKFHKTRFSDGGVDLSQAKFGQGNVDFQFAEFKKGEVNFQDAVFGNGDISFVNTEFGEGKVNFRNVRFGDGNLDFHFSRFEKGNISFDGAIIGDGRLDMRKVDFGEGRFDMRRVRMGNGDVVFDESEFRGGRVNFRSTRFGIGDISFKLVDFGENEVIFDKTDLGNGDVSFRKAAAGKLSFSDCHLNNYLDLRVSKAKALDLSGTVVRDVIDLIPVSSMQVEALYLNHMRNLGQIFIDWERNHVEQLIEAQQDTSAREKADQYLILKEDFNNMGQYNSEDKAYVLFKRHELKAQIKEGKEKNPWNALWLYPSAAFKWLVFDKMGRYATDPIRALTSMVVVYVLFSISYFLIPKFADAELVSSLGDPDKLNSLEVGFYHSAITFLTIGYGDYYPSGHFRWISSFEGFVGVFLMAYFTVAFVRKILR